MDKEEMRAKCNELILNLPEESLDELYETLLQLMEFYEHYVAQDDVWAKEKITLKAKLGKIINRPDFHIVDKE